MDAIFYLVPQLLNTLWTSKNEEEVRDIPEKLCQAFLACQQRMVTEDEVDEDSAILLCEFLVEGRNIILTRLNYILFVRSYPIFLADPQIRRALQRKAI
jgi:hypothetical protein